MPDINIFPSLERVILLEGSPWHDTYKKLDVKNVAPLAYDFAINFRAIEKFDRYKTASKFYFRFLEESR